MECILNVLFIKELLSVLRFTFSHVRVNVEIWSTDYTTDGIPDIIIIRTYQSESQSAKQSNKKSFLHFSSFKYIISFFFFLLHNFIR